MCGILEDFLLGLGYIFPAYVANATPVVAVRIIGKSHPLDMGKSLFDGKRILGDGKTLEGLVSGTAFGTLVGVVMKLAIPTLFRDILEVFLLSLGALLGDIAGAFIKRRAGIPHGAPAPVLDQLSFLAGSLAITHLYKGLPNWLTPQLTLYLALFTIAMHIGTNTIAYLLHLKDKWY